MTKANECTCPSGDGSLRHPCPAHPASVELAGVAANLTFINGRPAMCGCQVEYSSGGGEYSDVIYVTLCAKHSGSAILDLVATNRIALTPEYEGQWHADLYLDREIPLAKAEGATPAEAVLALMSAERIDPEQGGVDQAGGDRWDALQSIMEWTAAENIPDDRKLCLIRNAARAALAQPSPKCEFCGGTGEISGVEGEDDWVNGPCPRCAYPAQAEQAEAERPEVVGYLLTKGNGTLSILRAGSSDEPVMTVAQHDRIVDALRFERQQMDRAFTACINERDSLAKRWDEAVRYGARIEEQRDAALARVAELERVLRVVVNAADHGSWPTTVMHGIEKVREVLAGSAPPVKAQPEETPGEILAAKLIETWVTKHGKPAPWSTAVEITALATNMPNDERDRLLALDDDVDAQAQHSVPELDQLYSMLGAESQVDAAKKIAELIGCRMSRSALTEAQMRRIYENSTEIENERLGFAAFARLMRRAEAVHQIAAAPGKEGL
ncbi:TPA: hypothetical protein ACSQVU_001214 [Pseudomonas aeruginosa]